MPRMIQYHAVMIGETGEEFGADVEASSKEEARRKLRRDYPEARGIDQIESPEDTREREARIYRDIENGIDYDDDGRPFTHY